MPGTSHDCRVIAGRGETRRWKSCRWTWRKGIQYSVISLQSAVFSPQYGINCPADFICAPMRRLFASSLVIQTVQISSPSSWRFLPCPPQLLSSPLVVVLLQDSLQLIFCFHFFFTPLATLGVAPKGTRGVFMTSLLPTLSP